MYLMEAVGKDVDLGRVVLLCVGYCSVESLYKLLEMCVVHGYITVVYVYSSTR